MKNSENNFIIDRNVTKSNRVTRQNTIFYVPTLTTNVEFHSPFIQMQRAHDTHFSDVDLVNIQSLSVYRRLSANALRN